MSSGYCKGLVSPMGWLALLFILYSCLSGEYDAWRMSPQDIEKSEKICGIYKGESYRRRYKGTGSYSYLVGYEKLEFMIGKRGEVRDYLSGLVGKEVCFVYYDDLFSRSSIRYLFDVEVDGELFLGEDVSIDTYMSYRDIVRSNMYLYAVVAIIISHLICVFLRLKEDISRKNS